MAAKHSRAWKEHERATAAALRGERIGPTGKATADVVSDWCVIECKERQTLPLWLKGALRQAEGAAARYTAPRLPLVVLHELGGRRVDDLVIMRLSEFRAWFGDWRGAGEESGREGEI